MLFFLFTKSQSVFLLSYLIQTPTCTGKYLLSIVSVLFRDQNEINSAISGIKHPNTKGDFVLSERHVVSVLFILVSGTHTVCLVR